MENLKEIELAIDKLRGNSMKRIYKLFTIMCTICLIVVVLSNCFSRHESFNYSEIKEIQYTQYLGKHEVKEYVNYEDIKNISQKLQKLRLYPAKKDQRLQESPTASIYILYMNGSKKIVDIAGMMAMIKNITSNNGTSEGNGSIYYINPISVKAIFQ